MNQPSGDQSCHDFVCAMPSEERKRFIPKRTMLTLANEMGDYRCDSEATTLSLAILFMYMSTIFAYLVLSIVGDLIGRKTFIILGLVTMIIGIIWAILANSLFLAAAGLFIGLAGVQWAFSVSFVFIS